MAYSLAITFFYHNFVRIHQSLRMTPAMKAGVDDLIPELDYNTRPKKIRERELD